MARLLLDEQLPRRLARDFVGHECQSVQALRWSGISDEALLQRAQQSGFEVFITMDTNLPFQQAIDHLSLGILLLRARTNRYPDLAPHLADIERAATTTAPGTVQMLDLR